MLPRRNRLTRSEDFARIREAGECLTARRLVLCYQHNGGDSLRVGFSVSKRVGGAVVRNRIKRQLRAGIYPLCEAIEPGWDVVVIARQQAATASSAQLHAELDQLLQRAHLLKAATHEA
ncbi:MAG: ribonuclease P protein component [Anaerolineales bacterium]